MRFQKLFFFVGLTLLGVNAFAQSPVLTIIVPKFNPVQGELQVSLFNTAGSFLVEGKEFRIYRFKVDEVADKFVINDLPKGDYSMVIYHDKNNNGEMDRSFLGIPKEGYAFSNNFKPKLTGPKFEDCCIHLNADMAVSLELMY